ncbi:MAG TPA: polyphenol oxidase family protein [Myxococcota bacterium]|nr:polyphenol oxidase family protein [Myxococcota bacterium]
MSESPFLRAPGLAALGVEHGFGMRGSAEAAPSGLALAKQVHGVTLVRAPFTGRPEADAVWSAEPGAAVGVVTADCVPILLACRDGRAVCAVHAGWRGTAARIAALAVRAFARATGAPARELVAAIGPHIGPCCYEVDAPVLAAIPERSVFRAARPGHAMLDLFAANRAQLVGAGVPARAIERVGGCTACDSLRYVSYRRDKQSGRLVHWARVRPR